METRHPGGGMDHRVLQNIRFNARRLFRLAVVPGMDVADYEQDLLADLLHRERSFDPLRAAFGTFADRVVGNRSKTLAASTARLRGDKGWISIAAGSAGDDDEVAVSLVDQIADGARPLDDAAIVSIDMARFVAHLPDSLIDICAVLLAPSIASGAREVGVHRSTAYQRIAELRHRALAFGLSIYCEHASDTFGDLPVHGGEGASGAQPEMLNMKPGSRPPRIRLVIDERELRLWLAKAKPGDSIEYHQGNLSVDRLAHGSRLADRDRHQLDRVADLVFRLTAAGGGHLLQRRYAADQYGYLFVVSRNDSGELHALDSEEVAQ